MSVILIPVWTRRDPSSVGVWKATEWVWIVGFARTSMNVWRTLPVPPTLNATTLQEHSIASVSLASKWRAKGFAQVCWIWQCFWNPGRGFSIRIDMGRHVSWIVPTGFNSRAFYVTLGLRYLYHSCRAIACSSSTIIDVDECESDPCGSNAKCLNSPGSYSCICDDGYLLSGNECVGERRKIILYRNHVILTTITKDRNSIFSILSLLQFEHNCFHKIGYIMGLVVWPSVTVAALCCLLDVDECLEPPGSSKGHKCSFSSSCFNTLGTVKPDV